jgi:subtilase family serine protease
MLPGNVRMQVTARCLFAGVIFFLLSHLSATGFAQMPPSDLVRSAVNPKNQVLLKGHHPAWASPQNDVGAVPASLAIEHLTMVLNRPAQRQQAFEQLLRDQQNPSSSDYHHWLTPVEIGQRFGVSAHDLHAITAWLRSQGLHVDAISNSRERITFSGPAASVGSAFKAEMHYFTVNGDKRVSITAEPHIPAALAGVVKVVSGLYTIRLYPMHKSTSERIPALNGGIPSLATLSNGTHVVVPADFATIYNLNGVAGGLNGAGQTIAIVGRSGVCQADITNFASLTGVTINGPNVIVPPGGVTPPAPACSGKASGDQGEATLDVTRSGSIAQGATIDLVVSADTNTQDGIQIAATYVADTAPARVMSISFGACEVTAGRTGVLFWDGLFQQAAGEGISVFVSSGDSSAAGCDAAFHTPPATQDLSPNHICASSYATCVGGTEFADFANPAQYWGSTNGPNFESAISYIPEGAWNEPLNASSQLQVAGTGGGVSGFISTPSYQVGNGVPSARAGRYTPDISFSASQHDGYFGCMAASGGSCVVSNGSFSFVMFAGTSAAAPDMAGIAALLNQKEGSPQGLLNPTLYQLAANPANGVFNDVTLASSGVSNCVITTPSMCNNSTAGPAGLTGGLSGYAVNAGYDEATGLGSINVANLLTNWTAATVTPTSTALASPTAPPVIFGASTTFSATVSPAPAVTSPPQTVQFVATNSTTGRKSLGTAPLNSAGVATLTITNLPGGNNSVTAAYGGDFAFGASTSAILPFAVEDFTIAANPTTITISSPGQSGTSTITVTPQAGFNQAVTFSCPSGLPSEATCTFNPTSVTPNGTTAITTTLTVQTTAASALLDHRFGPNNLFFAMLIPGLLGLVVSTVGRKQTSRGVRLLSLIAMLAFSTLWLPACGGGSSSGPPSNPGTPAGTSPNVMVSATTGGSTPLVNPVAVTVVVQ